MAKEVEQLIRQTATLSFDIDTKIQQLSEYIDSQLDARIGMPVFHTDNFYQDSDVHDVQFPYRPYVAVTSVNGFAFTDDGGTIDIGPNFQEETGGERLVPNHDVVMEHLRAISEETGVEVMLARCEQQTVNRFHVYKNGERNKLYVSFYEDHCENCMCDSEESNDLDWFANGDGQ